MWTIKVRQYIRLKLHLEPLFGSTLPMLQFYAPFMGNRTLISGELQSLGIKLS